MRSIFGYLAWAFVAGTILFTVAHPAAGVIYSSPGVAISLGMIGLGLCMQARQNAMAQRQLQRVPATLRASVTGHEQK